MKDEWGYNLDDYGDWVFICHALTNFDLCIHPLANQENPLLENGYSQEDEEDGDLPIVLDSVS